MTNGSTLKLGLGLPNAGPLASPETITEAAIGAEEIGLASVWVLDRIVRPRAPKWGEAPPPYYSTVFDPIETLTYVAALTQRVELGTSVVQSLLHPPVILARRLATLDQLSRGRLTAGLGQGWMAEEFSIAGVPIRRRGRGMVEYLAALHATWGPDPVRFDGEFYQIPESDIGPKPARRIPILLGYHSDAGIRLAARHADGLLPNRRDLNTLRRDVEVFWETAAEAQRDVSTMRISFRGAARLESAASAARPLFVGTLDQWAEDVSGLAALGVHDLHLQLHTPVPEQLDTMAKLHEMVGSDGMAPSAA